MKSNRGYTILTAMAAVTLASAPALAQATKAPSAKHETTAQLKAEAKVTEKAARATALAQVPGGKVRSGELERENGRLVYSFDIATKGKTGIDEVQIDAMTGTVLSNKHETPAMEKAEAKADAQQHAAHKTHKQVKHDAKKA